MKVADAIGAQLDWMVAKCEGYECEFGDEVSGPWLVPQEGYLHDEKPLASFRPSTDWAQGGPIIEREEISVEPLYTAGGLDCWQAYGHNLRYDDQGNYIQGSDNRQYGPTPLIAAMRCYVASKLGDEVEVPEELLA